MLIFATKLYKSDYHPFNVAWTRLIEYDTRVAHYVLQSDFSITLTTTLSTPVFSKKPSSACTLLTILSNQLSVTPDHVNWGMSKMTPSMNARASSAF